MNEAASRAANAERASNRKSREQTPESLIGARSVSYNDAAMAIVLPFPLTIQEMRVLQEFRRLAADTLTVDVVKAIKHPAGGGEAPAQSLVAKGFLSANGHGYSVTEKAREFLTLDAKPEFESDSGSDETAE